MLTSPGPEAQRWELASIFMLNFTGWTVLILAPINSWTACNPIKNYLRKFLFDSLRMFYDSQKQMMPLSRL